MSVVLEKAGGGAGLGFGLDGGRDSPRGDFPLTIKKLFAGKKYYLFTFHCTLYELCKKDTVGI